MIVRCVFIFLGFNEIILMHHSFKFRSYVVLSFHDVTLDKIMFVLHFFSFKERHIYRKLLKKSMIDIKKKKRKTVLKSLKSAVSIVKIWWIFLFLVKALALCTSRKIYISFYYFIHKCSFVYTFILHANIMSPIYATLKTIDVCILI